MKPDTPLMLIAKLSKQPFLASQHTASGQRLSTENLDAFRFAPAAFATLSLGPVIG
jgi:hypothetical protein